MAPFHIGMEDVDFDLLATYLKALANPARLEILWHLRFPGSPADLEVRPRRKDDLSPDRPMSRQTVAGHLEQLDEAGVVSRVPAPEGGPDRWVTNVPQVFALVQELRKLTAIPVAPSLDLDETAATREDATTPWRAGPKLVLLSGPWEGRVFELGGSGPWTIGRSRSRHVALTYDPFVSAEHATLVRAGSVFSLTLAPEARNAARVNFADVPAAAAKPLRRGDIVSVGRSFLVFHDE